MLWFRASRPRFRQGSICEHDDLSGHMAFKNAVELRHSGYSSSIAVQQPEPSGQLNNQPNIS